MIKNSKCILVVAAHPDDEILGCGGTMNRLALEGVDVYTLILSAGKASRNGVDLAGEQEKLRVELEKANDILGVSKVFTADFPDNAFDSVALLEIVKKIEEVKEEVQPDIVFTHHAGDMNIDHQLTHKAVLTATRPMVSETVRDVYAFEITSSTEWNAFDRENLFLANVFVDITENMDAKIEAMAAYESELRDYPHPRSLRHLEELAKIWAVKVGVEGCAEAFSLVRRIID